ncbi:MAG: hypothetical protein KF771_07915 [Burkholderiales bacterium]|nr:hypothetical protein [Burkholderiales bacterium]
MNKLNKIAAAVALSLGLAAVVHASPMGANMGHGAQQGGQHQGMQGHAGQNRMEGMKQGRMQGMKHGESQAGHGKAQGHGPRGAQTGQSLITPEERTALRDKMRNAKTPEERQQIALANRAEMEKRAAEKGITLPEHRGPQGRNAAANTEHKH